MMQLRKAALHPFLFGRAGKDRPEDIIRSSGKLEALDRILAKLQAAGHKVLISSQFTGMLDIIAELLAMRKTEFLRIDGKVPAGERQKRIRRFSEDEHLLVFLLSSRAGGSA
eukprot:TRINITY_DN76999_c0_g1_i1.p1 TRINITY_DN76999_c0_g1~~TRINITY_DN76999_c0_g1_i1.p1  ORF type:complete len:112 (+),score=25.05 TRINITY_DN76999_c0_g1_i1:2-337(+)